MVIVPFRSGMMLNQESQQWDRFLNKQMISMSLWVYVFCHSLRSSAVLCVSAVEFHFFLTTGASAI